MYIPRCVSESVRCQRLMSAAPGCVGFGSPSGGCLCGPRTSDSARFPPWGLLSVRLLLTAAFPAAQSGGRPRAWRQDRPRV